MSFAQVGLIISILALSASVHCAEESVFASEWFKERQATERKAMSHAGGRVNRKGNVLTIVTKTKKFRFRTDDDPALVKSWPISYRYAGFFSQVGYGYHLVSRVQYYEDGDYLFISDASSHIVVMPDEPHVSPSGKYIVSVLGGEVEGSEIVVWRIEGDRLLEQYRHKPKEYFIPTFKRWNGENEVDIAADVYGQGQCKDQIISLPYRVRQSDSRWVLEPVKKEPECKQ